MKFKFVYLLGLAAFLLAGAAAFYSVYGLSQVFSGAYWPIIIMASSLEFAKLVSASFIYRYWKKISSLFKTYLISGIFVLMVITSLGIYGFLTNAYQKSSNELQMVDGQINIIDSKKTFYVDNIERMNEQIGIKSNRVNVLTNLRTQQEIRLDSLYNKNHITSAKRTERIIQQTNEDIVKANNDIELIASNIQVQNDSINKFNLQIVELKNTTIGDLGPLKYIAKVSGVPMDNVVNYLVLLLIFVFDPLAVSLVIATNMVLKDEQEPTSKKKVESPLVQKWAASGLLDGFAPLKSPPEFLKHAEQQIVPEIPIPESNPERSDIVPKSDDKPIIPGNYTDGRKPK